MSTIPVSAFADRLTSLSHEEFRSFVAELWSLAGWDCSTENGVVVATKDEREQRLLVLPSGRLARLRAQTPPADQVDRVVSPGLEGSETTSIGGREKPLVDARALRSRLIYGCESDVAERLWTDRFEKPLRTDEWDSRDPRVTWSQVALGLASVLLVGGAIAVLVLGLPLGDDSTGTQANTPAVAGGLDTEIEVGPPEESVGEPTAVAWGPTVYAGTDNGSLAAVDGETGATVWTAELDGALRSPLVSNGTVYVRSSESLFALDAVTGQQRWSHTDLDETRPDSSTNASTRLTVVDETVYFTNNESLVALEAATGDERWNSSVKTTADAPVVFDGTVHVTTPNGSVLAYDAATGDERWHTVYRENTSTSRGELTALPDRERGSLFVRDRSTLYELDTETERVGWEFLSPVSGDLSSPLALDRGSSLGLDANTTTDHSTVYVADFRTYLYALDPETGERRWDYQQPAAKLRHLTAGGPTGNESAYSLYLTGAVPSTEREGVVLALNASSGDERWRFETGEATAEPPTAADGTLYAGTSAGELLAIETADGTERWRTDALEGSVSGAVTVATDPLGGDSVDSRLRLNAAGHHDWFPTREDPDVDRGGGISVLETDVSERVAAGERIEVRVSLANLGDGPDNTTVDVEPGWELAEESGLETEIDFEPRQARELTASFAAPAEEGTYALDLWVGSDRTTAETTVVERPALEVTALDGPDTVWQNDETEIIATVQNAGDIGATTPIALAFDGELVDSTQRTVGANETASVTLSLAPGDLPAGEYSYSVATDESAASGSVEVLTVDRREDALPIVTQVFGVTLLLSGLGLGWRVLRDARE